MCPPIRSTILFCWLGFATPALAQTTLQWKFGAGDAFIVEQRILQATALEVKNKPFQQKSELHLTTQWSIKEADEEKAKATVTVVGMSSKVSAGDGKTSAPSQDDEHWRGAEFLLTVDRHGRLLELKGHEELLKKLAGNSPQRLKVLTALKPPDSFQSLFQDVLGPLAVKPVQPGDRWTHAWIDTMSIFGSFAQAADFSYRGERDDLHEVRGVIKTTYKAPRYAIENDVFRIVKGDVSSDDGKVVLLFDARQGRMRRVEKSINLRGELTLDTLNGRQRVTFTSATLVDIHVKAMPK